MDQLSPLKDQLYQIPSELTIYMDHFTSKCLPFSYLAWTSAVPIEQDARLFIHRTALFTPNITLKNCNSEDY